jgi:hypothetical protein
MDPIPCPCCDTFFVPRNKLQTFCSKPDCQLARKALWQKQKLATDPEYKKDQHLAQQKWLSNNPDYWSNYRRENPEKADRNRSLQKIRNHKAQAPKTIGIAKMDPSKPNNHRLLGQYWLVPTIAKMDPVKIFIVTASGCSP